MFRRVLEINSSTVRIALRYFVLLRKTLGYQRDPRNTVLGVAAPRRVLYFDEAPPDSASFSVVRVFEQKDRRDLCPAMQLGSLGEISTREIIHESSGERNEPLEALA